MAKRSMTRSEEREAAMKAPRSQEGAEKSGGQGIEWRKECRVTKRAPNGQDVVEHSEQRRVAGRAMCDQDIEWSGNRLASRAPGGRQGTELPGGHLDGAFLVTI